MHLKLLPVDSIEKQVDIKKIKEDDCLLRQRSSPNNNDSWWDFTDSYIIHQNLNNLIDTYKTNGEPIFQKYSKFSAIEDRIS